MLIGSEFVVVYRPGWPRRPWVWTLVECLVTSDGKPFLIPYAPGGYFRFRWQAISEARRQAERRGGMAVFVEDMPWIGPVSFGLMAMERDEPPPPPDETLGRR